MPPADSHQQQVTKKFYDDDDEVFTSNLHDKGCFVNAVAVFDANAVDSSVTGSSTLTDVEHGAAIFQPDLPASCLRQ